MYNSCHIWKLHFILWFLKDWHLRGQCPGLVAWWMVSGREAKLVTCFPGEQEDRRDGGSSGVGEGKATMDCHWTKRLWKYIHCSYTYPWYILSTYTVYYTIHYGQWSKCHVLGDIFSRFYLDNQSCLSLAIASRWELRQTLQSCSIRWTWTTQAEAFCSTNQRLQLKWLSIESFFLLKDRISWASSSESMERCELSPGDVTKTKLTTSLYTDRVQTLLRHEAANHRVWKWLSKTEE